MRLTLSANEYNTTCNLKLKARNKQNSIRNNSCILSALIN